MKKRFLVIFAIIITISLIGISLFEKNSKSSNSSNPLIGTWKAASYYKIVDGEIIPSKSDVFIGSKYAFQEDGIFSAPLVAHGLNNEIEYINYSYYLEDHTIIYQNTGKRAASFESEGQTNPKFEYEFETSKDKLTLKAQSIMLRESKIIKTLAVIELEK